MARVSARLQSLGEEASQVGILTKHFFERLFRNDIVDFADQMKARLIAVLSVLAAVIGWTSYFLVFFKYEFSPDFNTSWQDKNQVFLLIMILFGIVTLLEWEVLFPDRRDFVNLAPLPVRLRTVFAAKLASFAAFIALFSAAMNSLSAVAFALFLAQWRSNSVVFLVRHVLAHLASAFAACFCVFFACVFINVLLMAVLPAGLYRRVSLLVRFALIGLLIFLLLAVLVEPGSLNGVLRSMAKLKAHGSPLLLRVPSLWFVGLYEVLLGNPDPLFAALAKRAGLAFGFSFLAFVLACALSYVRHFQKTLESAKGEGRLLRLREQAAGGLLKAWLRTPEERAVGSFFLKTIRTSPKHRTLLANALAVGAALVMLAVTASRRNDQALTPDNAYFLAQSLLLLFVLLAGIRSVVDVPAALDSNWIFRIMESGNRHLYVTGLKKTIIGRWLMPLSALIFLAHLWLWKDGRSAGLHAVFCFVLGALVIEALFYRFRKIPFASPHVPGKLRLQTRGIPYLLGLLALLSSLSALEKSMLGHPVRFWVVWPAAGVLWALGWIGNARYLKANPLIFDEEPEPVMVGFPENG